MVCSTLGEMDIDFEKNSSLRDLHLLFKIIVLGDKQVTVHFHLSIIQHFVTLFLGWKEFSH